MSSGIVIIDPSQTSTTVLCSTTRKIVEFSHRDIGQQQTGLLRILNKVGRPTAVFVLGNAGQNGGMFEYWISTMIGSITTRTIVVSRAFYEYLENEWGCDVTSTVSLLNAILTTIEQEPHQICYRDTVYD